MRSIEDIKSMLSSDDINVVQECKNFIDERAVSERMRGESAERRANIILSTLGASSAVLVFIASNLIKDQQQAGWLILLMYASAVLWVCRSVWYCIKSIRTQSRYRVTEATVFEVQDRSEVDTIKEFLSGRIWEIQHSIQPNTERLFYVQRAQRALIIFIVILLFLGGILVAKDYLSIHLPIWILVMLSLAILLFWIFGDAVIEKRGIWNNR